MNTVINISFIIIFITLLIVAILILLNNHICDFQTCQLFNDAFEYQSLKTQLLYILDYLGEDGLISYAIITCLIICGLYFCILPVELNIVTFLLVFLLSFLIFYCILAFFVYHYIKPIKNYITDYINLPDETM